MEYDAESSSVTISYTTTQHSENKSPEGVLMCVLEHTNCLCLILSATGSRKSALLRSNVLTKEEEELNNESHDNHVTLTLGSLLQPKLITM